MILQAITILLAISALVRSYKMENIEIIKVENTQGELVEYVKINKGDDEYTTMLKSTWDELEAQREQSGTLTNQGGLN